MRRTVPATESMVLALSARAARVALLRGLRVKGR